MSYHNDNKYFSIPENGYTKLIIGWHFYSRHTINKIMLYRIFTGLHIFKEFFLFTSAVLNYVIDLMFFRRKRYGKMNSITKMEKFLYCTLKIPTDEQSVIHVFESAISRKSTRPNQQRKRSKVAKYIKVKQINMARRGVSLISKSQSNYIRNALLHKR